MNEKTKEVEKTDQKAKQEAKAGELPDEDLEKVAGGATITKSRSNTRNN